MRATRPKLGMPVREREQGRDCDRATKIERGRAQSKERERERATEREREKKKRNPERERDRERETKKREREREAHNKPCQKSDKEQDAFESPKSQDRLLDGCFSMRSTRLDLFVWRGRV